MRTCQHCTGINGRHMPNCTRFVTMPPLHLDIDPGTARLLEALRTPEPARVKVKPLGPSRYEQGNHLYLTSRSGFRAVCTKCGDVETYGMHFADLVADLGRRHLKREHAA